MRRSGSRVRNRQWLRGVLRNFKTIPVYMKKHIICILLSLSCGLASAVPINSIDIGDTYYINNLLRENDLVVVRRIDRGSGRVKVQYQRGGVDWVSATDLHSHSSARDTDTAEAVVGTALVAGAIWAMVDPDGFSEAMGNSDSTPSQPRPRNRPNSNPTPTVPIERTAILDDLPVAPPVRGDWRNKGNEWKRWAASQVEATTGTEPSLIRVRSKPTPFYHHDQGDVVLVEAATRNGTYYILAVAGTNIHEVLDGRGPTVHRFNSQVDLRLRNDRDAEQYLKFFMATISGEEGTFSILDPADDWISSGDVRQLGLEPLRARSVADGWEFEADVLYGGEIFRATLAVNSNGHVEMLNDQLKRQVEQSARVAVLERRFYRAR